VYPVHDAQEYRHFHDTRRRENAVRIQVNRLTRPETPDMDANLSVETRCERFHFPLEAVVPALCLNAGADEHQQQKGSNGFLHAIQMYEDKSKDLCVGIHDV
jgi:hypothetical protein